MEYPTQITIGGELVIFKRDWTTTERLRFERIFCAFIASNKNILPSSAIRYSFEQMVMLDDFYKQTQQTSHE